MVRINDTRSATRDGVSGTIFEIDVISLSEKEARGRARGAMLGRFPSAVGGIEIISSEPLEDPRFPGIDEYRVETFVPHKSFI